jgi:hypothetical protein
MQRVVIIDRDESRQGMAAGLRGAGYWVEEEGESGEGLSRVMEDPRCLVVMSEEMRGVGGRNC